MFVKQEEVVYKKAGFSKGVLNTGNRQKKYDNSKEERNLI